MNIHHRIKMETGKKIPAKTIRTQAGRTQAASHGTHSRPPGTDEQLAETRGPNTLPSVHEWAGIVGNGVVDHPGKHMILATVLAVDEAALAQKTIVGYALVMTVHDGRQAHVLVECKLPHLIFDVQALLRDILVNKPAGPVRKL
jgi:hypothetical protein